MKWLYAKKHLSHLNLVIALYIATIFYSLHYAVTLYLGAVYLEQYVSTGLVGLVFIVAALFTTYVTFSLSHYLNKYSNYRFMITAALMEVVVLLVMALTKDPIVALVFFIFQQILVNVIFVALNISLQEVSKKSESGSVRGVYFTILNLGILSAAFLSGTIYKSFSFVGVYITSALLLLPVIYIVYRYVHTISEPKYENISFLKTIKKIYEHKDIRNITLLQFLLECFFAVMVVYTTIYLSETIGIPTATVLQVILPFALLPFIIFPYELGILADTRIGEKELLIIGFTITGVVMLLVPFIQSTSVLVWGVVLFMSRVGASIIEAMASTYFYKKIDGSEAGIITLFVNSTRSLSLIFVPLVATFIFSVLNLPQYTIFIFIGVALLWGARIATRLHDTL